LVASYDLRPIATVYFGRSRQRKVKKPTGKKVKKTKASYDLLPASGMGQSWKK